LIRIGRKHRSFRMKSGCASAQGRLLVALAAILSLVQGTAWGVTVRAQLERSQIQLGDSVGLQITVTDSPGATITPQIPSIDGLSIQAAGSGVQWINGRRSDTRNYVVTPTREGKFAVPGIPVRVGGQMLRTNEFALTVSKTPESGQMRLMASVSKKECYVYEPVDVTFQWYVGPGVELYGRDPTFLSVQRLYALNIPLIQQAEELSLRTVRPPAAAEEIVANNRYGVQAAHTTRELNGTRYEVYSLSFRIFPPQSGSYVIPAATAEAQVQKGYKRVEDFVFTRTVPNYEEIRAASEAIRLTVKDLPAEGKPAEFTGAVGKYSISVQTADTQVKIGDPIVLKTTISGDGLLEKVKRPLLSQDPEFTKRFAINESLAPGDISGDRITFEHTIRATSEDVKEIPSVAFAYFDPDHAVYDIARSKPLPIMVLPTTRVTAEDVVNFQPETGVGGVTRLEEQPGGILANYNHLDALRDQSVKWHLLSILGLPPVAYLVVLTVVSRRRKLAGDVALARSRSARKSLKKHLAEARRDLEKDDRQFCDSLARAVSGFTSDKLNLGTGELTVYDLDVLVQQNRIHSETADKIADILRECDAARFAPSAQSADRRRELLRQAEEVIKALERSL
jgi:hypothetical protein